MQARMTIAALAMVTSAAMAGGSDDVWVCGSYQVPGGQVRALLALLAVDRAGPRWRYHQDDDLHRMARELLDAEGETSEAITRLAGAVSAILPVEAKAPPGPCLPAET